MARALAELSVLVILALLPIVLYLLNQFFLIHFMLRAGVCILSPLSLFGLWGICQIPFKVTVDDSAILAQALIKKQSLKWEEISSLRQTSRMGWRECSLSHKAGVLSFPCMLKNVSELLEFIRGKLPNRGRSTTGDAQSFKIPDSSFLFELVKLLLQALFAGLFIYFFSYLSASGKASKDDLIIVLSAAVLIAVSVIWKAIQLYRLPRQIELEKDRMTLKLPFKTVTLAWNEISKIAVSGILYPQGIFVWVNSKKYLIADLMDGYDELAEEVGQRSGPAKTI